MNHNLSIGTNWDGVVMTSFITMLRDHPLSSMSMSGVSGVVCVMGICGGDQPLRLRGCHYLIIITSSIYKVTLSLRLTVY